MSFFTTSSWFKFKYNSFLALKKINQQKLAFLFTTLVMAMAMILPITSYLVWKNSQTIEQQINLEPNIIIYLDKNITKEQKESIQTELSALFESNKIKYISAEQGLVDFKQWSGFESEFEGLAENPIPAVFEINSKNISFQDIQVMKINLSEHKGISEIQWPITELEKLEIINSASINLIWLFLISMLLTVILTIGNSIRLEIANQKENILIMKSLGATDYFISQPFLYLGMLYGVASGFVASFIVICLVLFIKQDVANIATALNVPLYISYLNWQECVFILIIAIFCGWFAAGIATKKIIKTLPAI